MRTTNPVFSRFTEAARQGGALSAGEVMTVGGTATKALVLLGLLAFSAGLVWQQIASGRTDLVMPALLVGTIGGLIFALITTFRPQSAPWSAPIYASFEGIALGAISALYNVRFAGLPQQAVLLTIGVAAGVLVLYRLGILRATAGFQRMVVGATAGVAIFYTISLLLSLFGIRTGYTGSSSLWAIAINVVIAGVAALNLVLDFDRIEEGARARAPKAFEWVAAFGLMVTLIWLYLELLRLLSRLQGRRS